MDTSPHTLSALFQQLGLDSDAWSIRTFVSSHPLSDASAKLHEAPWWSAGQAAFLKEALEQDAEWAVAVDELDALLRHAEFDSD